ncbi:MAG: hypothetical protein M0036_10040 [Desulfobacteraceae bacterium]|nr:hypothetical protein [Desulfobacteraceae bacterium]
MKSSMKNIKITSTIFAVMLIIGLLTVPAAMAAENEVQGVLFKSDNGGISLLEDQTATRYSLESGKSLSNMVGDHVTVTGNLEEKSNGKSIKVVSIERSDRPTGAGGAD